MEVEEEEVGRAHMASPIECDDRFYSKEEYKSLSPGNRVYLRQIRDKRTGSTTDNGPNKRMRASADNEFTRTAFRGMQTGKGEGTFGDVTDIFIHAALVDDHVKGG